MTGRLTAPATPCTETMTKHKASATPGTDQHQTAPAREERRVTSYDVALAAGVSQSAVSRCFKPGASVSKATMARVMKAASQLDYIPNAAARSLITRRSNMVAVIITNQANLYYPELLSALSQQITRRGKRVLLFTLARETEVDHMLADVWQYQVDGVIAAAALSDEQIAEFERRRLPLVVFNRSLRGQPVNSVQCDHVEAGRTLVSRLAAAGHSQFAIIDGSAHSSVAAERSRGACERLDELGLPPPVIVSGGFDYNSGARGLRDIIKQLGRVPDAVICGNDVMAIGCLDCARHELILMCRARCRWPASTRWSRPIGSVTTSPRCTSPSNKWPWPPPTCSAVSSTATKPSLNAACSMRSSSKAPPARLKPTPAAAALPQLAA